MGALKYAVVGVVVAVVVVIALVLLLQTPHRAPVHYVGSPSGYEAFVPNDQTINYNGQTHPVGDLILNNGTTIHNVIWDGQYAGTIIQNHNQTVQLNNQFVGQTDPFNNQQYVPLQDFYVIKGPVPIMNTTIDGQTYYVIEANNINQSDIAGFYTYQAWITNFVAAINTPGTYAAVLSGNSSAYYWANIAGTVAEQTKVYGHYGPFPGGYVLVLPNKTIISYGITDNVLGSSLFNFTTPQQSYNPSS